jgi:hypothetical protein
MRRPGLVTLGACCVWLVTAAPQCEQQPVEALLLESTPHTTHWGEWSAEIRAVAHVQSGDVVRSS